MQPVILLTFSNDEDDYLKEIGREQKAIKKALWSYDNNSSKLLVRDMAQASINDVFYLINQYHNRILFFHFGGHADGEGLQLNTPIGYSQHAYTKGIAGLLGSQEKLLLVFLNGCATEGQVQTLLDAGVKLVLATSVAIGDTSSREFSTQFYEALVAGKTILEAFEYAKNFYDSKYQDDSVKTIEETRGLKLRRESEEQLPWGLYFKKEGEKLLHEKLPTESYHEVMLDSAINQQSKLPKINNSLVKQVFLKIKDKSIFAEKLIINAQRDKQIIKQRFLRDAIIRSYLAPISVHLRTLFSIHLENYNKDRLQQIFTTYQRTIELLTFTVLSDLWDVINRSRHDVDYQENELVQLNAFFNLNEKHTLILIISNS